MPDEISQHRTARMVLHLPHEDTFQVAYSLLTYEVRRGIPRGQILLDGVLRAPAPARDLPALLDVFDSVLRVERGRA